MTTSRIYYTLIMLVLAALSSGCTAGIQGKVDTQEEAIREMRDSITTLRKSQADLTSEIDEIKQGLQTMQGTIEHNSMKTERALATLKQREEQPGALTNQVQPAGPPGTPATPVPAGGAPGAGTEGVAAPAPYPPPLPGQTPQPPPQPTAEWTYAEAYNTFKAGRYEAAREQFKKFLQLYKTSDLADNAQFWIGESYFKEKKHEEAIIAFEELIKNYPKGNKVAEAYYKQALSFIAINDPAAAKARLEMLLNEYPSGDFAGAAKQKLQELQQQVPAEEQQ